MTDTSALNALFMDVDVLLADFDGPICSIFGGYPATSIADDIRQMIKDAVMELPDDIPKGANPMVLLPWSVTIGRPDVTRLVEDALCAAEMQAADTARPTVGAEDMLKAAQARGLPVAIVSNNSPSAISAYLRRVQLDGLVAFIAGRSYAAPRLMKPDPNVVHRALSWLGIAPGRAVVIGDTTADIEAARAAGTASIGYANRPAKYESLALAGADIVVDDMAVIAKALRA